VRELFSNNQLTWKYVKLGDVTTSFSGGTPKSGVKEYYNGNIPFIRSGEIHQNYTELFLSDAGLRLSSAKLVNKGDLLYALYGATSGEVSISQIDGAINQAILCIRSNIINVRYLAYWLQYSKNDIISKMLQGGQGNLSADLVKKLTVPITSEDNQSNIVNMLSVLDNIIDNATVQYDLYNEYKRGLVQSMFI
jgi:type I restriction enzyme S subunit